MSDIFISYKQDDRGRVQLLADALEARGWDVWWDPEIRFGDNYRAVIGEALDGARCVVVAWSRSSVKSSWVLDEAEQGLQRGVLFPVKIEEGVKTPLGFGGTQTADLSAWMKDQTQAAAFERLCDAIAAKIGRPSVPTQDAGAGANAPKTVVAPLVKREPRGPLAGRPAWQLAAAAVVVVAALAAVIYFTAGGRSPATNYNGGAPQTSPAPSAGPAVGPSPNASAGPTATPRVLSPADEEAAAAPLRDLRCVLPGEAKNPILERAAGATPLPYTVDTTRHILLNKEGQPVAVVAAADLGGQLEDRRLIVAHFSGAPAMSTEKYFEQGGMNKASVHVLIARDGTVKQLVPFDYAANHAGNGTWDGLSGNLNRHSIGIDLENAGQLTRAGDGWQAFGRRVPDDEVALAGEEKAGWQKYTDAQLRAFFQVACALRRAYPTIEDVAGHDQVSSGRKVDPGPAFPMEEMRRSLFPAKRADSRAGAGQ